MSDGYVQVATDGDGKKIDNTELTRADGTVVERQRVVLGSGDVPGTVAKMLSNGKLVVVADVEPVVIQLKRIALLLEIIARKSVSERDVR